MTPSHLKEPVPAIPEDLFQIACGIIMEAKSLKSVIKHRDVADAIAAALLAERERSATAAKLRLERLELPNAAVVVWETVRKGGA